MRLNIASAGTNAANFQQCLSTMFWVRRNSTSENINSAEFNNLRSNLQTQLARSETYTSTANRVSWLSPVGPEDCRPASVYTLVQPPSAYCLQYPNRGAAVTELQLFTRVNLKKFRSNANIWDDNFHRMWLCALCVFGR